MPVVMVVYAVPGRGWVSAHPIVKVGDVQLGDDGWKAVATLECLEGLNPSWGRAISQVFNRAVLTYLGRYDSPRVRAFEWLLEAAGEMYSQHDIYTAEMRDGRISRRAYARKGGQT